jgi:SAM-dependent methyltransferase
MNPTTWKDLFSRQAEDYAKYRPHYPQALYDFLVTLVEERKVAWDCGTGNGQVATQLAAFFDRVIATDASSSQLAHAIKLPNLEYRVAMAEQSGLASQSVNFISIAQAIHWFDFDPFYQEVRRVAVPGAVVAAWGYGLLKISAPLDEVLRYLYSHLLGPYWELERRHLDQAYQTIPFPFPLLNTPSFTMQSSWNLAELMGYLNTWSAIQKFRAANNNCNPLEEISEELQNRWGEALGSRPVQWDIYLKVGRVNARSRSPKR